MNLLKVLIKSNSCRINSATFTKSIDKKFIKPKKVAVILSGCGFYDGSDVTEASSIMIHLDRNNAESYFFAPDVDQLNVVNHQDQSIQPLNRNVLIESARITRGNIQALSKLVVSDFDAMIIPGGLGVTKNLSDYYIKNPNMEQDKSDYYIKKYHSHVLKNLERLIWDFSIGMKPIGIDIAPVIAEKILPQCDWLLSYGNLVTTEINYNECSFYELHTAVGKLIDKVLLNS